MFKIEKILISVTYNFISLIIMEIELLEQIYPDNVSIVSDNTI